MVARIKGPTDHVVVVGAGLAGLSAALLLAELAFGLGITARGL
jgi:glycine/D-amino acid oxidase-like deaminating enzyme